MNKLIFFLQILLTMRDKIEAKALNGHSLVRKLAWLGEMLQCWNLYRPSR
jgi:hypothetical protein